MTFFNFQNSSRESENNVGINSWDSLNKKVINQKPYWLHLKKKKKNRIPVLIKNI